MKHFNCLQFFTQEEDPGVRKNVFEWKGGNQPFFFEEYRKKSPRKRGGWALQTPQGKDHQALHSGIQDIPKAGQKIQTKTNQ